MTAQIRTFPSLTEPLAFGPRLRAERLRCNLELHDMAHLGGVTDYMQKRFENGTSTMPIDYLEALHTRSDADVLFIITGTRCQ
ncbi:XRE family transcriptional regulator [Stutzerimonas xanthomarina]|uniref:XRE family transcriptional regulator n=1 Tax=Stutzerimonas xanthomarina TaxID=271420 RepID=UPI003AA90C97